MALPSSRTAIRAATASIFAPTSTSSYTLLAPSATLLPNLLLRRNLSRTPVRRNDEDEYEPDLSSVIVPAPLPLRRTSKSTGRDSARSSIAGDVVDSRPRWSYTPEAMKAPFNPDVPVDPQRGVWAVNNDPGLLDEMYVRLLGREGPKMLQEEVKWLAVTHKSFDQGRRGFNDKLAYFGRTALMMECAQWISSSAPKPGSTVPDKHGRTPFRHRSLEMCDNLNALQPLSVISREKIQKLALNVGLDKVLRWKPKHPGNLEWSGYNVVLNGAVYAIVGAIWLQNGAEVGGRVIRDKILRRVLAIE